MVEHEGQHGQYHNTNGYSAPAETIERNADEGERHEERNVLTLLVLTHIALVNGPQRSGYQEDDVDDETRVERHAEHVDKQQLEPSAHGDDAGNHAIEHGGHNGERHEQGNE